MPRKLKVFRTPIGFHDAYVAAPSQKAALEAWGADSNLFAQGTAEQVEDAELMKEPLERPGEVVKRLRGTQEEQIAAVAAVPKEKKGKEGRAARASRPSAKAKRPPKPRRDELDTAEAALKALEAAQQGELRALQREMDALERRRREMQRRHEREHDEQAAERDCLRAAYERDLRRWEKAK